MAIEEMLKTHPRGATDGVSALAEALAAADICAQTCVICADACLAEARVDDLRQCIRLNLDCADMCRAMSRIAARRTGDNRSVTSELLDLCARACHECAQECGKHEHAHCRVCAEACARCEDACRTARLAVAV